MLVGLKPATFLRSFPEAPTSPGMRMKRMPQVDLRNLVIMVLLGLLGVALGSSLQQARSGSGGGGDSARDLIAVSANYSTGAAALYVLDARTQHMAVYRVENGRALELIAARDISYDLKLESYGDQSVPGMLPASLRAKWDRWTKAGGRGAKGFATPPTSETPEAGETGPRGPTVTNLDTGVTNTPSGK
jgi:hypothetical protein